MNDVQMMMWGVGVIGHGGLLRAFSFARWNPVAFRAVSYSNFKFVIEYIIVYFTFTWLDIGQMYGLWFL